MNIELGHRVLVVDADDRDRRAIVALLHRDKAGLFHLAQANSVAAALSMLAEQDFDLVIANWTLPDGSALDLVNIRGAPEEQPPLIVVADEEHLVDDEYALSHGAADVLGRADLTPSVISRACRHALARRCLEHEVDALRCAEQQARISAEKALEASQRSERRTAAIEGFAAALGTATTTDEIAAVIVDHLELFEGANALSVYVVDGDAIRIVGSVGYSPASLANWRTIPLSVSVPLTDAVLRNEPVYVATKGELHARTQREHVPDGSWLAMPLANHELALGVLGLRFGVLGVRFPAGATPDLQALGVVELLADHAAQALFRARLYEEARRSAEFDAWLLGAFADALSEPADAVRRLAKSVAESQALAVQTAEFESQLQTLQDLLSQATTRRSRLSDREAAHMQKQPLDVVVAQQVERLRAAHPQREIQISVAANQVHVDPARVAQIVSNLVRNGLQHGGDDEPVRVDVTGDSLLSVLTVQSARVLPAHELLAITNALANGPRAMGEDLGFGLFIVRECVHGIGGQLSVSSDPGGTTFTVVVRDLPKRWAEHAPGPDSRFRS